MTARYATALARDPHETYRRIDIVGRTTGTDSAGLVQLLYDELVRSLRAAATAAERRDHALKSERVTRATAILFALEAGLDFDAGGEVSVTLARLYAGARRSVVEASIGYDPAPFREVANNLDEIAQAWRTLRAR